MYEYHATVRRVVDGDTLDLRIDLGFTVHVEIRVRLGRVDTPEVHGVKKSSEEYARGKVASEFVAQWLQEADAFGVPIIIRTQKTGKYGRWIAEVLDTDGVCLNDVLIEKGWGA
jgi:micrococcal nuclease